LKQDWGWVGHWNGNSSGCSAIDSNTSQPRCAVTLSHLLHSNSALQCARMPCWAHSHTTCCPASFIPKIRHACGQHRNGLDRGLDTRFLGSFPFRGGRGAIITWPASRLSFLGGANGILRNFQSFQAARGSEWRVAACEPVRSPEGECRLPCDSSRGRPRACFPAAKVWAGSWRCGGPRTWDGEALDPPSRVWKSGVRRLRRVTALTRGQNVAVRRTVYGGDLAQ
jgi:hypothetical protein